MWTQGQETRGNINHCGWNNTFILIKVILSRNWMKVKQNSDMDCGLPVVILVYTLTPPLKLSYQPFQNHVLFHSVQHYYHSQCVKESLWNFCKCQHLRQNSNITHPRMRTRCYKFLQLSSLYLLGWCVRGAWKKKKKQAKGPKQHQLEGHLVINPSLKCMTATKGDMIYRKNLLSGYVCSWTSHSIAERKPMTP